MSISLYFLKICNAGEKGAGKSSFINLLLGTDILPVHAIDGTQTICELRKSKNNEKEAICFFKRGSSKERKHTEKIHIDDAKGIEELKRRIKEKDREDESPYERIEIYMPLQLLGVIQRVLNLNNLAMYFLLSKFSKLGGLIRIDSLRNIFRFTLLGRCYNCGWSWYWGKWKR